MTRLPPLTPAALNAEQQRLYADITAGPRGQGPRPFELVGEAGALVGPFNAMLLRPVLGMALQGLGAAIRYRGSLPDRARELAILVVAGHWDCAFERHAHEAAGRAAGLTEADLATIRAGGLPDVADATELAAVRVAWALVRAGDLDDREYAEAVSALGEDGLFELTTLVGYYATLALQLRVFRVGAPERPQ